MILLILFLLSTIGLTDILVTGAIIGLIKVQGKTLREWLNYWPWSAELFSCHQCTGFWSGVLNGLMLGICQLSPSWITQFWIVLACGFAGSVVSSMYVQLVYLIEGHTPLGDIHEPTED